MPFILSLRITAYVNLRNAMVKITDQKRFFNLLEESFFYRTYKLDRRFLVLRRKPTIDEQAIFMAARLPNAECLKYSSKITLHVLQ